jgi:hypothetical protein
MSFRIAENCSATFSETGSTLMAANRAAGKDASGCVVDGVAGSVVEVAPGRVVEVAPGRVVEVDPTVDADGSTETAVLASSIKTSSDDVEQLAAKAMAARAPAVNANPMGLITGLCTASQCVAASDFGVLIPAMK